DYLGANTNDVNLANLNNIDVKYALLNNGTKTDKTKEEVSKLEYMDGKDSVEYIYTVTDADKVCVASDTVFVTINRKPTTPIIENGLDTIYFCKDDAPILLGAKDINPDQTKTDIFWGEYTSAYSNDSLKITESFKKYTAFTKNVETGCVSIPDTIVAYISNSVYFKRFGVKKYCYGEVVDLKNMIQKAINNQNNPQFKSNIGFQVYKVNGTTPNAAPVSKDVLSSLHSIKGRNVDDSTRYYLEVLDSISGCNITDTFSIIFRGLPTIKKIDDIVVCQLGDTLLPTPTDSRYEYHWLRANDKEILPMPAVLQLEKSETIRLVAVDTMDCQDTLAVYMDVKKIPTSAIAYNDTFCQNSGTHLIPVSTQASEDNETESLSIQWFSEQMDSIQRPINTDTVVMNEMKKVIPYIIRQTNSLTGCYKDTTIHITINKALDLRMQDVERVCQPEIVDFDTEVWDYLQSNTAAVNLTNLDNINVEYALLNNGNKKPMTKEEVAKLEYMEGKDSVSYIYTVTDGKKVCVASDTVFVTINRKPTTPIIENGLDTIYFCKDDAPILLGAKDINPDQTKTNIFWGEYTSAYSNDSLNITEVYKTYTAFSKEMETGCVSIPDTIVAFISGSLNFKSFGVKKYCYGEVVNLDSMITDAIKAQNHSEFKSNIGYQLYKMNGTTASAAINKDILSSIHSTKGRNVDDSTRYSLEVLDSISGCRISDEFSIIFRGLPTIKKIDNIVVCQYADTLLPTPTDSRYEYKWLRADDREILPKPEKLQLEKSETIRVIAIDTMGCSDTLEVYMDVKKIPTSAIAYNDTFCQNTGVHLIPVSTKVSEDNASGSLSIQWFSEQMDSISNPIKTDSVEMNGLRKVIPYTIRQTNRITGCYKDTTIQITINKALDLRMQDVERVCQPEIVDFDTKVWDYLLSNTEAVNLTNIDNINVEYALLNNGNKKPMTKEEVSKLEYMDGKDSVSYIYTVTDAEKVCVASDTVFVTINRKPSIPVIENGMDTIYFCKDNAPLYIKAKDKNIDATLTDIFWGEYENGTKGDSLLISENKNDMLYIAYSQNNYTTCVSDPDSIIVIVASPIETKTIGKNGTIELCVNEHINVMDTAKASFIIDKKRLSVIKYSITANGFDIVENELADVTKTVQDTTNYVFTVKDELTGCETTNKLRLIFHQKPTFRIEGKSTLCQGNDMELKAVGENRAVSYVWLTEGQDKVESTTSTFTLKNIMADTTILLVERLEGTSCYDTITQKIKVYETPAQLEDREFIFCQDSKGADEKVFIKRDEQDSIKFRLQWLDDDNTEMFQSETIDIPVVKDTVYTYLVKQLNIQTDTVCHGELSEVSFRINKHTDVTLRDTNVCMPEPFNLAAYAKNKRKESTTGYELAIDRITFLSNGIDSDIEDSTKVTQTGIYKIHYTDKNGCETENTTKVNFINKPDMPAFKVDMPIYLCQGVDTVIVPNLIAGDYIYIWNKIGGNDTITSDTLKISAEKASGSPIQYQVWRKDSIYGCESEKADISYQVLDSIKITIPETLHICEYETIDLDSVGHTLFSSENTLELKAFNSNEMAETLNQLLYYNAISDSGYYLIKVKDVVSNCQAKALVKLDIHEAPILLFDGDTTVCSGDKIELKAKPSEGKAEPKYQWIDARGKTIDGKTLAYVSTIDEMGEFDPLPLGEETARLDTVQLIGLYNITNDKICQKERSVALTINPIPQKLENDTVDICQKTGIVNIPVNYQNNVYNLKMYKESTEITAIEVNTENIGEQKFETRTENRLTQCLSEPAWVLANVRSAIQLNLDTIQGICEPEVFNLEEIVNKAALSSNDELLEAKTYTITSITRNGIEITDRNAIDKSGLYHTVISDQYGCTAKDTIRLAVNKQPASISGDTVFCQNTGIQILNEKGTNSDLVVEWLDLEFAYPDSIFSETMKIKTDIAETRNYLIRQKFPSSNCASVPTPMTVTIHPAIHSDLRDTTICYGNTFDLPAYAQNHVSEGTEPSVLNYRRTETIVPLDYNAIAQKGTFIVNYTDKNSCSANDTMTLSIAPKIELKLEGNKPVCNGNNINIKASGADHYVWNEVSEDIDSINIATSGVGVTDITLSASIDVNEETSCNLDTIISITVNKVPDLIQDYGDTLYCQNAETEALSLNATDNDAKVLWYDPNDNYSAVSQNGTLRPASMYDGEFIYKFRQQLGECYTEMQDYPVNIQKAIEEVAVVRDTAYCKDEKTAPLSATWTNPQYELIWTDEEGNVLPNVYEPSSAVAGIQKYEAKLSFKACMGQPAKMTVSVQERYNEIPDVNDSFIFCENTGSYTLKANNKKDGVRLNWYQDGSDERMDSIIINTDESTWKSSSFYATQSMINGCESQSKTVDVTIADAIKPMTIDIDTCANLDI
ncbi:MAG: hypothetical protein M0P12_09880, partial [Paludibacteraceae bacterium]|nr:hypothetical protein [Paludibacteraceae bacterium]